MRTGKGVKAGIDRGIIQQNGLQRRRAWQINVEDRRRDLVVGGKVFPGPQGIEENPIAATLKQIVLIVDGEIMPLSHII